MAKKFKSISAYTKDADVIAKLAEKPKRNQADVVHELLQAFDGETETGLILDEETGKEIKRIANQSKCEESEVIALLLQRSKDAGAGINLDAETQKQITSIAADKKCTEGEAVKYLLNGKVYENAHLLVIDKEDAKHAVVNALKKYVDENKIEDAKTINENDFVKFVCEKYLGTIKKEEKKA